MNDGKDSEMKSEKMWIAVEIEVEKGPEFHKYLKENLNSYRGFCSDGNSLKRTGRFSVIGKPKGKIEWETNYGRSIRGRF